MCFLFLFLHKQFCAARQSQRAFSLHTRLRTVVCVGFDQNPAAHCVLATSRCVTVPATSFSPHVAYEPYYVLVISQALDLHVTWRYVEKKKTGELYGGFVFLGFVPECGGGGSVVRALTREAAILSCVSNHIIPLERSLLKKDQIKISRNAPQTPGSFVVFYKFRLYARRHGVTRRVSVQN